MKKRFTLLLLYLALTIGCATAQVTLIPKAGISFTSYKIKNSFGNQIEEFIEPGTLAGMALNLLSSNIPWLSLQPELNYLQRRHSSQSKATIEGLYGAEIQFPKLRSTHHYVEVPMLFKATKVKGKWQGFFNVGPALGYALAGSYTSGDRKETYNFENSNRFEASVQAGAGIGVQVGRGTLLLEARYSHGLTNLIKEHSQTFLYVGEGDVFQFDVVFPADQKSRVLSFTMGYAIPLNIN